MRHRPSKATNSAPSSVTVPDAQIARSGSRIDPPGEGGPDATGMQDAKAWLAAIVEGSDDAIVSKTLDGVITSWNRAAVRLFGFTSAEAIGQPIRILIPADRQQEEDAILAQIRRGERIDHFETVRRRKDGSLCDVSLTVSPVRGDQRTIIGVSKIARDISERKRDQERQRLLLREMNHRIKNLFAVASSLVAVSRQSASSAADLATKLQSRLAALARAHDLTLPDLSDAMDGDRATTLFALLGAILAPHSDGGDGRTIISGSDIPIHGEALTALALALNEFATNAAKYGCLSAVGGVLSIESVIDVPDLVLRWTEAHGPEIRSPAVATGFGTQLSRSAIEGSLNGSLSWDWAPSGLTISIRLPISRLSA